MKPQKAFNFTIGLLYPAILGSIIFNMFDAFSVQRITGDPVRYVLVFLILVHYVLDYLCTNTAKIRNDYSVPQGICDFLIVALLFISINAAYDVPRFQPLTPYVALLLAGTKLLGVFWELFRRKKDLLAIKLFGIFFLVYYGVYLITASVQLVLLVVLLIIDIFTYYYFESIKAYLQRWHSGRRRSVS
jgi:hypothetical protein